MAYNILVQTKTCSRRFRETFKKIQKNLCVEQFKIYCTVHFWESGKYIFSYCIVLSNLCKYIVPCLITNFLRINPGLGIRSFQKNVPIFAFFSVLYKRTFRSLHSFLFFIKRMFRSLHSFPFFIKERSDLCVLFRSL